MSFLKTLKISAALVALSAGGALANDVEVLHWWTSG
jgi:glucose/mannose transport system substrate-binding protein